MSFHELIFPLSHAGKGIDTDGSCGCCLTSQHVSSVLEEPEEMPDVYTFLRQVIDVIAHRLRVAIRERI